MTRPDPLRADLRGCPEGLVLRVMLNRPFIPPIRPGWAGVYVIFYPTNVADGRRVYFIEKDAAVISAAKKERRTADLIVPAAEQSGP